MYQELISITINVPCLFNGNILSHVTLLEMFIAPSAIVRSFADFLACRDDDETFTVKGVKVPFLECSVTVGDSKKAINAFECLKHYDIKSTTHSICADLIECTVEKENELWSNDENFKHFAKWFRLNQLTKSIN